MNVGIMSMQRIFNYGSWMQAYALRNIIEEIGCSVQFVDYHIGNPVIHSLREGLAYYSRKIKHLVEEEITDNRKLCDIIPNEWFRNEYNFKHNDLSELLGRSLSRNYNSIVDCLVVGSDEVFNCLQISPRVGFSPELLGDYKWAKRKISYAASFGNTTIEKINSSGRRKEIEKYINKFDSISVRDENSRQIIRELTHRNPSVNLDPVLIWDFSKVLRDMKRPREGKYIIVYTYPNRLSEEECLGIKEFAHKQGLTILGINANYRFLDEMVF